MRAQFLLAGLASLFLANCQAPSNTHVSVREFEHVKPQVPEYAPVTPITATWKEINLEGFDVSYNPKVDILFVIDNSASMLSAQQNLSKNINQFTQQFLRNKHIDFQIGVTTNWDHYTEKFLQTHTEGPGALMPISGLDRRYLKSSDSNLAQKLSSLLRVGTLSLEAGGPEHEAFLTPIVNATERGKRGDLNEGFIREEALLAVIILTDADDMSLSLTPDEAARRLAQLKKDPSMVVAYGVLVNKNDPNALKDPGLRKIPAYHPDCFYQVGNTFKDNGTCPDKFGPERLENFIFAINKNRGSKEQVQKKYIFSLAQSKFGTYLANMGQDIVAQVSSKLLPLDVRPQVNQNYQPMIEVSYGTSEKGFEIVPTSAWTYQSSENAVFIPGPWSKDLTLGGFFKVRVLPLTYIIE